MPEIKVIPRLPKRSPASHKGTFGHILVIAGSRGMAGAAALCGASALRSGAGLVTVACPAEVQPTVAQYEPSYMTWPLAQTSHGGLDIDDALPDIETLVARANVVAAGPGLGSNNEISGLAAWLLNLPKPAVVLDADALNSLASDTGALAITRDAPTIITPHPGEFARLTGSPTQEIQSDRTGHAMRFAQKYNGRVVVVLKGHETVVTDGVSFYKNSSGNPGMATGGSGDCLTGVIAALLGQGMSALDAAVLGSYVHGLAGDIARDQNGEVGMIAGDIVDALPDAFYHLGEPD